jgi:GNAT superfamily N-acetyltransferase
MPAPAPNLDIQPVTADRWDDLAQLFGPSGAYSGCWCMWWRVKGSQFSANGNSGNRAAMQSIVARDEVPGLLAYAEGAPVGWISLGPREAFGRLQRSPLLKPIDAQAVWSIVCFFIHRDHRNQGVAIALITAAEDYARAHGARILEAYPIDTGGSTKDQAAIFTGTAAMFRRAGYQEAARRKATRPIFRKHLS